MRFPAPGPPPIVAASTSPVSSRSAGSHCATNRSTWRVRCSRACWVSSPPGVATSRPRVAQFAEADRLAFAIDWRNPHMRPWTPDYVEALLELGRIDDAREVLA